MGSAIDARRMSSRRIVAGLNIRRRGNATATRVRNRSRERGCNKKGFTPERRNPFRCTVPKTGLEPALPVREPAPEAGASAVLLRCGDVANTLQAQQLQWFTTSPPFVDIHALWSRRQQ